MHQRSSYQTPKRWLISGHGHRRVNGASVDVVNKFSEASLESERPWRAALSASRLRLDCFLVIVAVQSREVESISSLPHQYASEVSEERRAAGPQRQLDDWQQQIQDDITKHNSKQHNSGPYSEITR